MAATAHTLPRLKAAAPMPNARLKRPRVGRTSSELLDRSFGQGVDRRLASHVDCCRHRLIPGAAHLSGDRAAPIGVNV